MASPEVDPESTILLELAGDRLTITVAGELDMATCGSLDTVTRALATDPPKQVVVDLAAATFMDGAGVHALIRLRQAVPKMQLVNANGAALLVLEVTHMLDYLNDGPAGT